MRCPNDSFAVIRRIPGRTPSARSVTASPSPASGLPAAGASSRPPFTATTRGFGSRWDVKLDNSLESISCRTYTSACTLNVLSAFQSRTGLPARTRSSSSPKPPAARVERRLRGSVAPQRTVAESQQNDRSYFHQLRSWVEVPYVDSLGGHSHSRGQ